MSGTPTVLTLSQAAMRQVHDVLGGKSNALAEAVAQTRKLRGRGEVVWRGVLTPATIHHIGGLSALASEHGAITDFEPQGLDEREQAFLKDYATYGPAAAKGIDGGGTLSALVSAGSEAAYALWQMRPRAKRGKRPSKGGKAVIIGAYGGDHIGDTAILGGVLMHLKNTFGISSADVLSSRPEHTARLIQGLDSLVSVSVFPYTPRMIGKRLHDAVLLIIAGGPVMDLPRVLARHLASAHKARALGAQFHVERVGVGPFRRKLSRIAARHLLEQAETISLRTTGASKDPTLAGLSFSVGCDPAFDYLGARQALDRTTGAIEEATQLLAGTDGHARVGINLRPIRHAWAAKGANFSREADERFYHELALGMRCIAKNSPRPVTFVFFPMNPIEFGMSDLAAAYRLHKLLGDGVDFRVWEADPDVDDVLWLLRKLDAVLAMRFHAAIFAISQQRPAFGIDYYPGEGGKVEQLFEDIGRPDDAVRMDLFSSDWLVKKLQRVSSRPAVAEQSA